MRSTCSLLPTSTFTNLASPPFASIAATVWAPPSSLKSATTTRAPSAANSIDASRPMPFPPPVISATLPSRRPMQEPPTIRPGTLEEKGSSSAMQVSVTISGLSRLFGDDLAGVIDTARVADEAGIDQLVLPDHLAIGTRLDRYPY